MRKRAGPVVGLWMCVGWACCGWGQAVPLRSQTPVSELFHLPTLGGTLRYSVSATERLTLGYDGGSETSSATGISGNLAFLSSSERRPFSLIYSGGYLGNTTGQGSAFFQNLAASQVFDTRRWNVTLADTLNYLPETAVTGLSGLAGLGDQGIAGPNGSDGQGVLTRFATRVTNDASGSVTRKLTGMTAVEGSGSYRVERYLGVAGALETNQSSFSGGVSHRIDARTSVDGSYNLSRFDYLGLPGVLETQGVSVQYTRQWTRKVRLNAAIGPQRVAGRQLTGTGPTYSYTANVSLAYVGEAMNGSAYYTRATNGGSGVNVGAEADTVGVQGSRRLTRVLAASGSMTYNRTNGLASVTLVPLNTQSVVGNVQATRALGRNLSMYVSYSAQRQTRSGVGGSGLALSGLVQVLGFGVTYAPALLHLARH